MDTAEPKCMSLAPSSGTTVAFSAQTPSARTKEKAAPEPLSGSSYPGRPDDSNVPGGGDAKSEFQGFSVICQA